MLGDQLDSAAAADERTRADLIRELAAQPDEALPVAVDALNHPPQSRWEIAVRVIRAIGYPDNAPAIPALVGHLGDPNWPGWDEAVETLQDIGPRVVVPYLIRILWHGGQNTQHWTDDVEGVCSMLCRVDRAFAVLCGPVIAFLLGQAPEPDRPDSASLLDVLDVVGAESAAFALPALISFIEREGASNAGEQARRLISSFDEESLHPYAYVLT